ncbi:hypothetical protein G9H71_05585 [Motilibacter sp. E257]|uniref:Uncharacterized protein n=1 Tax=Motilibacter deserti TaxID=2714956 RepID=A0ABX0GR92_9ACTN|nr:hypothetical protein [Motilibacter deserti]
MPGDAFGAEGDTPAGGTSRGAAADPEANEADALEQATELDDRDTGPAEPVPSLTEAAEADLAEQGRVVAFDEDDYR